MSLSIRDVDVVEHDHRIMHNHAAAATKQCYSVFKSFLTRNSVTFRVTT